LLKCPIHELPRNIVINNFYARLSGHYKDYLDACFEGSFTSKEVDAKWDLLETIKSNIKDWDCNKGKESGINYAYVCIKSFAETAHFQELSAKYGLDSQIMVDFYRAFALGEAFFALECICTLYLKCIFDIFENIKKSKKKMFCVRIHVLRAYKVDSTKTDFLYDLCKNDKIWY
jgi:hypothetical protein